MDWLSGRAPRSLSLPVTGSERFSEEPVNGCGDEGAGQDLAAGGAADRCQGRTYPFRPLL